ncbi:MAG: exodeoxyribonuclease V subunit gamma [Kiritimatiellia bacterium]|jgi:exodeoxyribonuclease V gamma subunit|nr:exodeoxyribonuclease V subunit gamma [Kiritimatiellia bacterium]
MSFTLYHGNRLDQLAAALADRILQPPAAGAAPDPLRQETVVVPNQGLARWLALEIAARRKLCPPLDLPYPGAFLYRDLFDPMMGRPSHPAQPDLPFAPATVEWRLFALLEQLEPEATFARVRAFTRGDPLRRYQLAGRLASLYDRYMTYRPDLLAAWEQGNEPLAGEDAAWQAGLWRELIALDCGGVRHFSGLYRRFLDLTRCPDRPPGFLAPLLARRRIAYFGVSSLPPAHLDVLIRLARFDGFEIHFFTPNPCCEEWSDARSLKIQIRDRVTLVQTLGPRLAPAYEIRANPLLGSLGRSGREFFSLLLAYDEIRDERLFAEPDAADGTVLGTLQRGILHNVPPETRQAFNPSDRSLVIHACHAPLREVESLYDHLLALFRDEPDLAPREISVYTPDIETFAPYIEAVFGKAPPGTPGHIPYAIADKSLLHTVDECRAWLALLTAVTGRFKASEVLGLLQHAALRQRFNLEEADLPRLGSLLRAARLAWGLDAAFRERQGASPAYANTWRFALDRLLFGAAMLDPSGDAPPLKLAEGECLPLAEAEGHAALIGRLASFLDALTELHDFCLSRPARPCAAWHAGLNAALARFFTADERAPYGVLLLRQTFDQFARYIEHAGCERLAVPFAVVRAWLTAQLSGTPGSERFVTGRVTFSRFQPMRNVPARVVCLLGLSDKAFPRNAPQLSFDLMDRRENRRIGDRQPRDEDRYAFLETLLAARERLIITYTGQSDQDNKPLPPSVLVSELLDAADAAFAFPPRDGFPQTAATALTVRHPLHPFSPAYFTRAKPDPRLRVFDAAAFRVACRLAGANGNAPPQPEAQMDLPPAEPAPPGEPLQLEALIAFFLSPCKVFYTRRLNVALTERDDELPDDLETLEPDSLVQYQIRQELAEAMLRGGGGFTVSRLRDRWQTEGRLPVDADRHMTAACDQADGVIQKVNALHLGDPLDPQPFDLDLPGGLRLQGTLHALRAGNAQLFMRPAQEKAKDIVTAWLTHLAACAAGPGVTTWGVFDGTQTTVTCYQPLEPDAARRTLASLVALRAEGMTRPLCFDPAIGRKLAEGKALTENDWTGSSFQPDSGVDAYLRHAFGATLPEPDSEPLRTLERVARALFGGMTKTSEKIRRGGRP